ncbi:MAG: helix-turn-helix domain-containing protein [Lentisphaeria bacterium]|nr:helix-turn-helix domain-containing protein [Lentisphaeria bacterium]
MSDKKYLINAIRAYERQFHCRLCLHDYTGKLPRGILPSYHLNPFCTAFKEAHPQLHRICYSFDRFAVQEFWLKKPVFMFKLCPCGLLEAVFPVIDDDRIAGCLFAGPFTAELRRMEKNPELFRLSSKPVVFFSKKPGKASPLPRDMMTFQAYGEFISVHIAMLAREKSSHQPIGEREQIEQYLEQNFHRNIGLDDVAELLSLSPARASNRIRRIFGKGFCRILRERRIEAAEKLLARSCFNVENIACRCGFRDGAYFHRIFRLETGISPLAYRRRHQTETV